jgi:flagellar biosynthesis/type III secretory pathway protein FliH
MVFEYLYSKQRGNLILLAKFYADMILQKDDEKHWLQRRFDSMNEFLWENTSVYRDILASGKKQGFAQGEQKGLERGLAQGEQKGLEQGLKQGIEALQRVIESTIQTRFPCLLPLVKETIAHLNDLEQCQKLSLMLSSAQTEDEAKDALLAF